MSPCRWPVPGALLALSLWAGPLVAQSSAIEARGIPLEEVPSGAIVNNFDIVGNEAFSDSEIKNRIYTEGKGEKQPVASNKTRDGRAKNRRVEIEVIGTRRN